MNNLFFFFFTRAILLQIIITLQQLITNRLLRLKSGVKNIMITL